MNHSLPTGDTLEAFNFYTFFYNHIYFFGSPPMWLPFGFNGSATELWTLGTVTPTGYLTAYACAALGVKQALTPFLLSLFLNESLFLFGAFFLSRYLFKETKVITAVCLICSGTVFWGYQVAFSFNLFYGHPFTLLLLIYAIQKRSFKALACLPGVVALFHIGVASYFLIAEALFYSAFGAALFYFEKAYKGWKPKELLPALPLLGISSLLSFAYVTFLLNGMSEITVFSPGREAATGATEFGSFLSWGSPHLGQLFQLFYALPANGPLGSPNIWAPDVSLYIGFIPLFFLFYSFLGKASPTQKALTVTALFFIALSSSYATFIAPLLYHVPGLSQFRHIGYLLMLIKVPLIFLSGYGFSKFINSKTIEPVFLKLGTFFIVFIFLVDAAMGGRLPYSASYVPNFIPASQYHFFWFATFALTFFFLWIRKEKNTADWVKFFSILFLLEMVSLVSFYPIAFQLRKPKAEFKTHLVKPYTYSLVRGADRTRPTQGYEYIYTQDTCGGGARKDLVPQGISKLFQRELKLTEPMTFEQWGAALTESIWGEKGSASLRDSLACGTDKLYVSHNGKKINSKIKVLNASANHLKVEVDSLSAGNLIRLDPYLKGWRATVNGAEKNIQVFNDAHFAIPVEAGKQVVEFIYTGGRNAFLWSILPYFCIALSLMAMGMSGMYAFKRK